MKASWPPGVPAALSGLLTALKAYGRLPFGDVAAPARAIARDGFPMHVGLLEMWKFGVRPLAEKFRSIWPGSAALYLPSDQVPQEGDRFVNQPLAALLDHLIEVEAASTGSRSAGIEAVHDAFYRGEVASTIDAFSEARDGLLCAADLAAFHARFEAPLAVEFHGSQVYKCGPWNQGPALLQCLTLLRHFDLQAMAHGSADYLHTLIEVMKLAFADREQFYGDPQQVDVPVQGLLSRAYAGARAALINPDEANCELRPGDPVRGTALLPTAARLGGSTWGPGTVHVDVADSEGNLASFTPSGGWLMSAEVMPELGFPLGNRLMTFYLGPAHHPNLVAPGKQPRTTISPGLVRRGDASWIALGSMGGDQQDQWLLQFILNRLVFDMPLQQAIEAPKLSSEHFPGFFAPHDRCVNRVRVEPRISAEVRAALACKGHDIDLGCDWSEGYVLAVERHDHNGLLEAGCDPRGTKGAVFPAFALAW